MFPQGEPKARYQLQDCGWLDTALGRYMRTWRVFRVSDTLAVLCPVYIVTDCLAKSALLLLQFGNLHSIEPDQLTVWQCVIQQDSHLGRPNILAVITLSTEDELGFQMLIRTSTCRDDVGDHI